jgi:hypothetical protein
VEQQKDLAALHASYTSMYEWTTKAQKALSELSLARHGLITQPIDPGALPTPPLDTEEDDSMLWPTDEDTGDVARGDKNGDMMTEADAHSEADASSSRMRLARRKQGMKLAVELHARPRNLSRSCSRTPPAERAQKMEQTPAHDQREPSAPPVPTAAERVARALAMFGELVDARMESCRSMEALVRDASEPTEI